MERPFIIPREKLIPGTNFTVDGFRHQHPSIKAYFLSHAHSDHYQGITDQWSAGSIYCSPITAQLVTHLCGVDPGFVVPLEMNTIHSIHGVEVVLVDANHCPGAVQFLFRPPDGRRWLHCGDCRYSSTMLDDPHLQAWGRGCHGVFLDTTYCKPKYAGIPKQETAVDHVVSTIASLLATPVPEGGDDSGDDAPLPEAKSSPGDSSAEAAVHGAMGVAAALLAPAGDALQAAMGNDAVQHQQLDAALGTEAVEAATGQQQGQQEGACFSVRGAAAAGGGSVQAGRGRHARLLLISTYVIGKERILLAVHKHCGLKLYVTPQKLETLRRCLPELGRDGALGLLSVFTTDPCETPVHVVPWGFLGDTWPFFRPNFTNMERHREEFGAQEVVAFCPTGWMYENRRQMFPIRRKGRCTVHLVPYSEHSTYSELLEYVQWLRPQQVIPTVGVGGDGGERSRAAMLSRFTNLVDSTAGKARFLSLFTPAGISAVKQEPCGAAELGATPPAGTALATAVAANKQAVASAIPACAMSEQSEACITSRVKDVMPGWQGAGATVAKQVPLALQQQEVAAVAGRAGEAELEREQLVSRQLSSANASTSASATPRSGTQGGGGSVGGGRERGATSRSGEVLTAAEQQLAAVLQGSDLSVEDIQQLLAAARGDVAYAVSLHYDGGAPAVRAGTQASGAGTKKAMRAAGAWEVGPHADSMQGTAVPRGTRPTASQGKMNRQAAGGTATGSRAAPGKQAGRGGARAAATGGPAGGAPHAAARNPANPTQRSIETFFRGAATPTSSGPVEGPGTAHLPTPLNSGVDTARASPAMAQPPAALTPHLGGLQDEGPPERMPKRVSATQLTVADQRDGDAASISVHSAGPTDVHHATLCVSPTVSTSSPMAVDELKSRHGDGDPHLAAALAASSLAPGAALTVLPAAEAGAALGAAGAGVQCPTDPGPSHKVAKGGMSAFFSPRRLATVRAASAAPGVSPTQSAPHQASLPAAAPGTASLTLSGAVFAGSGATGAPSAGGATTTGVALAGGSGADDPEVWRGALERPLAQYDPVGHACWHAGQPAPYLHLALALESLESTTKRLKKEEVLTNMFRSLLALSSAETVVAALYLATGRIAPEYLPGGELNVGGSTVSAALSEATGTSRQRLREMFSKLGDLGDVAQACRRNQSVLRSPAPLGITSLLRSLRQMAADKGGGAAGRRQQLVLGLLRACRGVETKYVVRTLVQNLRVGANWRSVLGPLARAVVMHHAATGFAAPIATSAADPSVPTADGTDLGPDAIAVPVTPPKPSRGGGRRRAKQLDVPVGPATAVGMPSKPELDTAAAAATAAYHVCPNFELLVPAMVEGGVRGLLDRCTLTPGVPAQPMLAKICEGVADGIRMLGPGPFLAEYKYDGVRSQIHLLQDGQVRVFSRNCEDRTESFPDVVALVRAAVAGPGGASSLVLDAEVVAVEPPPPGSPLDVPLRLRAFQELSTRARGEVQAHQVTVQVAVFVFDVLHIDGESLLGLPLRQRRAWIARALPGMLPGKVQLATSIEIVPPTPDTPAAMAAAAGGESPTTPAPATAAEGQDKVSSAQQPVVDAVPTTLPGRPGGTADVDTAGACEAPNDAAAGAGPGTALDEVTSGDAGMAVESMASTLAVEEQVYDYMLTAFAAGTEGVMLKRLDRAATYEPSRRADSWIKIKRDYCEGLRDSVDAVVIGAWQGQGRKVKWYSPFLMAVYDPDREEYQSLCRCMSGFSDIFYEAATARLGQHIIPGPKPYYNTGESCHVWFEPSEVWEIRGADLSLSPVHRAAAGRLHLDRGVGMRFPRFIRIREDKQPEEASSAEFIQDLYNKQTRKIGGSTGGGVGAGRPVPSAGTPDRAGDVANRAAASPSDRRGGVQSGHKRAKLPTDEVGDDEHDLDGSDTGEDSGNEAGVK